MPGNKKYSEQQRKVGERRDGRRSGREQSDRFDNRSGRQSSGGHRSGVAQRSGGSYSGAQNQGNAYWPRAGEAPTLRQIQVNSNQANDLEALAGIRLDNCSGYAPKPAPGIAGEPLPLLANLFSLKLSFKDELRIYQYNVTIEPQDFAAPNDGEAAAAPAPGFRRRSRKLSKQLNRVVVDWMVRENSSDNGLFAQLFAVYDSDKILYTKTALNCESAFAIRENGTVHFRIPVAVIEEPGERPSNFIVELKHVATLNILPNAETYRPEELQFIDIALRHGPTDNKIAIDTKLFKKQGTRTVRELPGNKELAFGHYQSVRQTEAGLMLNVDFATCVFHIGDNVINIFARSLKEDINNLPQIPERDIRKIAMELKGLRFRATHLSYPFKRRVDDVSPQSAQRIVFPLQETDENGEINSVLISVSNYFETKYQQLQYPHFPCFVVGNRNPPLYFPVEVCDLLPDQFISRKLPPQLQKDVSYILGKQRPNQRYREIETAVRSIKRDGSDILRHFGIDIVEGFVPVTGRVLKVPGLIFKDIDYFEPEDASWIMQRDPPKKFLDGVHVSSWTLVDMSTSNYEGRSLFPPGFVQEFKRELIKIGKEVGINIDNINDRAFKRYVYRDFEDLKQNVFQWAKRNVRNLQLIVAIIPDETEIYASIKKLGDVDFGVATQCVSTKHYRRNEPHPKLLSRAYLTNLVLKINAKLNGVNTALDMELDSKHVMFVGVDVTHPPPGKENKYSIASCVASYDDTYVRYFAKSSVQDKTRKEIVEIDVFLRELLDKYQERNNRYPESVIIYRDGVSEGEFAHVMNCEVDSLVTLFNGIERRPRMTYIVVQKGHNIRFITANLKDATRSGNIPAGTVVDTVVNHPSLFSFFLCSHHGLLGTSRPPLYTVLYDDNGFNSDKIQRITFYNTFLLPRTTRSVSLPAPVVFADLCALRQRQNLLVALDLEAGDGAEDAENEEQIRELNEMMKVNESLEKLLYYV